MKLNIVRFVNLHFTLLLLYIVSVYCTVYSVQCSLGVYFGLIMKLYSVYTIRCPKFKRVSLNESSEFAFWGLNNFVDFDLRKRSWFIGNKQQFSKDLCLQSLLLFLIKH